MHLCMRSCAYPNAPRQYLSILSFNIDIAAPECLYPNLDFRYKFFAMEGLPVLAACIFILIHVGKVCACAPAQSMLFY